jgi:hypothetical protein
VPRAGYRPLPIKQRRVDVDLDADGGVNAFMWKKRTASDSAFSMSIRWA